VHPDLACAHVRLLADAKAQLAPHAGRRSKDGQALVIRIEDRDAVFGQGREQGALLVRHAIDRA
jgi:hypothetical protein